MFQDIAEGLPQPRQRTLSFYVVLLCLILPLWSVAPLSWAFVVYVLSSRRVSSFAWPGSVLFATALCEVTLCPMFRPTRKLTSSQVLFSIYHYRLSVRISGPSPIGPGEPSEVQTAFKRLLKTGLGDLPENGDNEEAGRLGIPEENIIRLERDDPRAIDFRNSIRTWFCKVPWSSIKLHEVRQWLYWTIFNAALPPLGEIPHSRRVILDEAVDLLEKRSGCQFQEGSNPAIRPILLTLDKVNVMWRPLIYYTIICSINFFLRMWYKNKWNVRFGSRDGLERVSSFYVLRLPS